MRVAFSHDWLTGMRGGEKCLESLCRLYPNSKISTLLYLKGTVSETIESRVEEISFLQNLPRASSSYRYYLPLLPLAVRSLRLPPCDLAISTSHCVAKAIRVPRGTPHISYCFTPMRYAWLFFDEYFGKFPPVFKWLLKPLLASLRWWDAHSNSRVTHFVAISHHIRKRIQDYYKRNADVIYPPVDTHFYTPSSDPREDFYLLVSALVPYKKVDLAIKAFNKIGKRLVIVGSGQQKEALQAMAGPNIEFLDWQSNEAIRKLYRTTKALIFPGEEDFGIVPVEAQGCGTPVIAYGRGGVLETVIPKLTGVFFFDPTEEAIKEAVEQSERIDWNPETIRQNALKYREERFLEEFKTLVKEITESSALGVSVGAKS
jgi:glycosyltransferase involved in cell wall biosynthesis